MLATDIEIRIELDPDGRHVVWGRVWRFGGGDEAYDRLHEMMKPDTPYKIEARP